ncbi:MAG: methyltransferase domain-containing protein [Candidatus Rokuibacteriota bacterium]
MSSASPRLWSLGAGPGSASYEAFDAARRSLNRRLAARLLRRMEGAWSAAPRTLEAGSGPGYCSSILATMKPEIRAAILDFDREPLAIAAARDARIAAIQGDLYRIPFADGSFDLVFNSSTMEHLDSFAPALAEMVRVTRSGGKLFVGVPYRFGPFLPFNLVPAGYGVADWMGTLFSRTELVAACGAARVVVEETHRYFFGCFIGLLLSKERRPEAAGHAV